ncbi:Glycoside hydrolase, family 37 like protein, partial [Aduncisulcus paluster]
YLVAKGPDNLKRFCDYDMDAGAVFDQCHTGFYPTGLTPFVYDVFDSDNVYVDFDSMRGADWDASVSGVPTSAYKSADVAYAEQWDGDNVWAPFHWMYVTALEKANRHADALNEATKWVQSVYCGWIQTDSFFEKYDATVLGLPGGGGEYGVQVGFGWTNGLTLRLLFDFGSEMTIDPSICPTTD